MLWLALIPEVSSARETAASEPNYLGLASLLAAGLLVWWVLRRLARRGVAGHASDRMNRGMGQALVALGSILQPHTPAPEDIPDAAAERDEDHRSRKPDPERAPVLFEGGGFPADGLRTRLDEPEPRRPELRVIE